METQTNSVSHSPETITVLLIEDNPGDARLIREILARARGAQFELKRAECLSEGLERLAAGGIDAVLLDLSLPDSSGLETFLKVHEQAPRVPITVLSGFDDEVVAVRAVREGAQDYLVKGQVDRNLLVRALRYAIERKRSEEALQRHDAILQAVSDSAEQFLKTSDLERHMEVVLKQLGQATQVGRVYISENAWRDDGTLVTTRHHEWTAAGACPQISDPIFHEMSLLSIGLERWELALGRGQDIRGNVRDFPLEEQHLLAAQNVRSTAVVPIFVGREWWGFVGLEDCSAERDWPDVEIDGLTAAAGILGAAIQRKRSEEAERRLAEMKDDFIATVSHELRTPLFALQGFLELLRSGKVRDVETQQEFLTTAAQNATRLMGLVNDLLDISRLESGEEKLQVERVEVNELIAETLESLRSLADGKRIAIKATVNAPEVDLIVQADRAKLRQVLVNLVGNAIKFSEAEQPVTVTAETKDGYIRISVTDVGPGIASDEIPRLFGKFYRAEKPLTRATGGAGLGLYISRRIVEAHSGTMGVDSKLGRGSTFYFQIPTITNANGPRLGSGGPDGRDPGPVGFDEEA
jgi:signal transduction histidine kinase/DNA-binding NarL/FixJ family response regulator